MSEAMLKLRLREIDEARMRVESAKRHEVERRALLVQECKRLRVARDISLREMARLVECSAAMLCDIELGRRYSERIVEQYAGSLLTFAPRDAAKGEG